jgi:hypothetical protein
VDAAELTGMVERLQIGGCTAGDDAERITAIARLETLRNVASALQVELTAEVAASREQELAHVSTSRSGSGRVGMSARRSGWPGG